MTLRPTYAKTSELQYRLRSVSALLGITDKIVRAYEESTGLHVKRASELNPDSPPARVFDMETIFRIAQWRRTSGAVKTPVVGPIIISSYVIKGGTAKTTTAVELAVHLQCQGLRVLLIDFDIQANATQMLGYEPDLTLDEASDFGVSAEAIVQDTFSSLLVPYVDYMNRGTSTFSIKNRRTEEIIKKPFGLFGPHLIPADTFVSEIEQALFNAKGQRELLTHQFIETSKLGSIAGFNANNYDVIIFDCPPSVSFTSASALAASDFVVAPIRLDAFSVKGLSKLMSEIQVISRNYQLRPDLVILPTYYEPQLARIGRMQLQLNQYRDLLAPNVISASEDFPKSLGAYLPLSIQKPTSPSAKEYRMFAEFMFTKILAKSVEKAEKNKKVEK